MVVAVCSAIRRVVGPFQLVMDMLLSDSDVLQEFQLAGIRPEHVQVRLPGELTGPSATYTIVVRHPRNRKHSQAAWSPEDFERDGQQHVDELNYIMESRPEKGLYVFIHSGMRRAGQAQHPKTILEGIADLYIEKSEIDCEVQGCPFEDMAPDLWQTTCWHASAHVQKARKAHSDIAKASGLLGEGDGNVLDLPETVWESLRSLSAAPLVCSSRQEAKTRGEARREAAPPLGDLGPRTWPRDPVDVYREDWKDIRHMHAHMHATMDELAWRLVDHVVVQLHGRTASQIAVPLLDPLPGYTSPTYGTSGQDASRARSLLAGFVMCVWALYEAHRDADNGPPAWAPPRVHHTAPAPAGGGGA